MNTKLKKSLAMAGVASSLGLAVVAGTGMASAASSTNPATPTSNDGQSSLVDKLAAKFGLKKADVQAVFDENRAAHEAERQQRIEDKLTQAVSDGKITADQKTQIEAKLKELKADMEANRDSMRDKTPAERKAAMEAKRADLEKWAADNNIPVEYLHMGMRGGHGPGGFDGTGAPGQSSVQTN